VNDTLNSILRKLDLVKMGTLNLEIQVAQLDTEASRGAMVATEHIKNQVQEIETLVKSLKSYFFNI
jgi:hypothetical protein